MFKEAFAYGRQKGEPFWKVVILLLLTCLARKLLQIA